MRNSTVCPCFSGEGLGSIEFLCTSNSMPSSLVIAPIPSCGLKRVNVHRISVHLSRKLDVWRTSDAEPSVLKKHFILSRFVAIISARSRFSIRVSCFHSLELFAPGPQRTDELKITVVQTG